MMNPLRKYHDNPGFERAADEGDLWKAIGSCSTRIAVVDERFRVALLFCIPILGFIIALLLTLLGLIGSHMLGAGA